MADRLLSVVSFLLVGGLVLLGISVPYALGPNKSALAADDSWWVGKGVTQNTYYNYILQYIDTNNGRPFLMSIYFQKQDDSGRWIAPIYVQDNGKVIQGTLLLGQNLAVERGPGSNISSDLDPYLTAYANSLGWLNAFSPQSNPKKLSDPDWGKIGCIGCSDLLPSGPQKITTPAGSYDTTILEVHYGQTNSKIWVNENMPYPVNATFFAATTISNPPIQYAIELNQTGTGQPIPPPNAPKPVMPPLTLDTPDSKYKIQLDWSPVAIMPKGNVSFTISFLDNTGAPLNQPVNYYVRVSDEHGANVRSADKQNSDGNGVGHQSISFPNPGSFTVEVGINNVGDQPQSDFIEKADFAIVVAPEFPLNTMTVFLAALGTGIVAALSRTRILELLFGRKSNP